ncbi:MAG: preprotein translocase subunit YajC [Clostridia bacterium]|nr:preprotein translocase subunit YajC [Clostridia bacterium]
MNKIFKKLIAFVSTIGVVCAGSMVMVSAAEASATPAAGGKQGGGWMSLILPIGYILFIVLIGYFLIFRPNKKRKQQEEKLRSSLMLGDQIVTIGGICGTIVNIKDDVITIESSLDKTLIEFKNWAIREVKKLETDDEPAK